MRFMTAHCQWLVENGCTGVVALGSLGEGATLSFDEKTCDFEELRERLKGRGFGGGGDFVADHGGIGEPGEGRADGWM